MPVDISKIVAQKKEKIPAKTQYDSLWGYYTFSQTVQFEYDDTGTSGLSNVTIIINGFYTANSETLNSNSLNSDNAKNDALFAKYEALRKKLLSCVRKKRPKRPSDIGTDKDERCIELPPKLINNNSETIYAIPVSFSTTEISPEILRYTATFVEPKTVTCKLAIGTDIIDDATVSIICRRPRITYRNFVFASGSEAYVTGIDNRKYTVSGTLNGSSGNTYSDYVDINTSNSGSDSGLDSSSGLSEDVVEIVSGIINSGNGVVSIGIQKDSDSTPVTAFKFMLTSHNVNHMSANGVTNIELSGEETDYSNSNSSNITI